MDNDKKNSCQSTDTNGIKNLNRTETFQFQVQRCLPVVSRLELNLSAKAHATMRIEVQAYRQFRSSFLMSSTRKYHQLSQSISGICIER